MTPPHSFQDTPPPRKPPIVPIVLVLALVGVGSFIIRSVMQPTAPTLTVPTSTGTGKPAQQNAPKLETTGAQAAPSNQPLEAPPAEITALAWVDVLKPAEVHQALLGNAWLKQTASEPLGRGFIGPWAAFFGTRQKDLGGSVEEIVLTSFVDGVLTDPYRVAWLTGGTNEHLPAVIVPKPSSKATLKLNALSALAGRGTFGSPQCAGDAAPEANADVTDGGLVAAHTIQRLVIGDEALFASVSNDRLVISRSPNAVQLGLCVKELTVNAAGATHAAELGLNVNRQGRALQALVHTLGLSENLKLALDVNKDGFAPKGLLASLNKPGRLAAAALSDNALKLIPESTGVMLSFSLTLPEKLDTAAFEKLIAQEELEAGGVARNMVVLWNPRGDTGFPTEVALVWDKPEDEAFFASISSKKSGLLRKTICNHLVLASTKEQLDAMEASCSGKKPSMLSAAPAVAQGLKANASLGLSVNLGGVLSQLVSDGWLSQPQSLQGTPSGPARIAPPKEIEDARKQLSELPFLHWRGVVDEKGSWTLGGFRT